MFLLPFEIGTLFLLDSPVPLLPSRGCVAPHPVPPPADEVFFFTSDEASLLQDAWVMKSRGVELDPVRREIGFFFSGNPYPCDFAVAHVFQLVSLSTESVFSPLCINPSSNVLFLSFPQCRCAHLFSLQLLGGFLPENV